MTQLTKEHLDKALDTQTKELKAHTEKEVAELARMVTEGFDTVQQQLDVRDDVNQLKVKVARISQAIGLSK